MKDLTDVLALRRPLLGLDLETTGRNPDSARICEVGLKIMAPGLPTKRYRTLVNPGVPIPKGATEKHGITDEMVRDARPFASFVDNFITGFAGADFAGYHVTYDLRVLLAEFKRCRRKWDWEGAKVIDAFRLWQVAEPRTLEDAIKYWLPEAVPPVEGDNRPHSALWDVEASTLVAAAQIVKGELGSDVGVIHDLCNPGQYDALSKLVWDDDGELSTGGWGKHPYTKLADVDGGYLGWMLKNDFSDKVKLACERAKRGERLMKEAPDVP